MSNKMGAKDDTSTLNCDKCGAPDARNLNYAGVLCAACDAALKKICDFCSADAPNWRYPVQDFAALEGVSTSVGEWAACNLCHDLIEAGKFAELLEWSLQTLVGKRREFRE